MGSFLTGATGTGNGYVAPKPVGQDFNGNLDQGQNQFNQIFGQQSNLASQLQNVANGQGPNPAQAMLQQATNNNIHQQAGAIASQKGLSPALAARLAAQNGAQISQQAAGQGALMGAQQQLGAMGQLANVYGQQSQGAQGMYGTNQNALSNFNSAQNGASQIQAGVASGNQQMAGKLVGGALQGVGSAIGLAEGGTVPGYACGGSSQMVAKGGEIQGKVPGQPEVPYDAKKNDKVRTMLTPGEGIIDLDTLKDTGAVGKAARFVMAHIEHKNGGQKKSDGAYAEGGEVPLALQADPAPVDPLQLPTSIAPYDPAQAVKDQAAQTTNGMAEAFPGEHQQEAESASNVFQEGQYRRAHGLGLQNLPEGVSFGQKPNEPLPPDQSQMQDQGPANMPSRTQPSAQGSGGGGSLDQYMNQQHQLYENQGKAEQDARDKSMADENLIKQRRMDLVKDYEDQKIDPKHVFATMGTGEKVGTVVGLILSGLGSGLTGQPNAALGLLNKKIDNDIEAQKDNKTGTLNLLRMNEQDLGDSRSAAELTRIHQRDIFANELQKQATNSKNPIAKQQASALYNGLMLQNEQSTAQLKMWQQMKNQNPNQMQDPVQKARMMIQMGMIPDKEQDNVYKDLEKSQNASRMKQNMMQAFETANKENTLAGRAVHGGSEPASVAAMQNLIMPILKDNEGRINEQELHRVDSLIPRPGDGPRKVLEKRQAMMQFIDAKSSTPRLQAYGLGAGQPQQQPITSFKRAK